MDPHDILKTAVTTPFSLLEFLQKPFGLCNAAQTFQRFIDQVLCRLHFCYVYMDNILITCTTAEEHQEHLRLLFTHLQDFSIVINPTKCIFGVPEKNFLGHCVNCSGIRPLKEKVQIIQDFLLLSLQCKLREFWASSTFTINLFQTLPQHCSR